MMNGIFNLFHKKIKKNKELDALIAGIVNNESNNYKDAAQDYLKKFDAKFRELCETDALTDEQKKYYGDILVETKERLTGYTHKDQKPYWT